MEHYVKIEDAAARAAVIPVSGFNGRIRRGGSWSILGCMMMNCRSLGEAFEKSAKYYRIIGDLIEGRSRSARTRSGWPSPYRPTLPRSPATASSASSRARSR